MLHQAQQLSVDLEQAREQLAIKNKDNLKLREEIMTLEERLRETANQLKMAQDALSTETQVREKLDKR